MGSHDVLTPGSVFAGSFRVFELVGEGEMGTTYLVDPLSRGQRCVLKAMVASLVKQKAIRKRFAAQARATSRIASPHVLQTLDAGIDRATGRPWFTADLLRGEDLASRVSRCGAQPLSEVCAVVAAMGDALGKAHAEGVVHHDLTPENIHLGAGKPSWVMLRELTVARLVFDACAAEGDVVGSPMWMAPEQLDPERPLTPAANVWSLGLLAFYATTGRPYWRHATGDRPPSKALLREILVDPIASASERAAALGRGSALPPWFDAWFARCVTHDPSKRFPDTAAAHAAFAKSFGEGPYDLTEDPDDDYDDEETTTRFPAKPASAKGSRRVPRSLIAEARGGQVALSSSPPPAVTAERAPASARTRGRTRIALRYLAVATACAAALAWFGLTRHRGEQHVATAPLAPSESASTEAVASGHDVVSGREAANGHEAEQAEPLALGPDVARPPESAAEVALAGKDAPGGTGGFDLAGALKALNAIHYGGCAVPTAGKLAITFAPSGRVKKVEVLRGNYDARATRCVAARFGAATVAPFRGGPQTVTADLVPTR